LGGVLAATHTSRIHRMCIVFQLRLDAMLRLFPATPEAKIRGKPGQLASTRRHFLFSIIFHYFFFFPRVRDESTWECEEWNNTQYTPLKKASLKFAFRG
jgi:hypothetical protein